MRRAFRPFDIKSEGDLRLILDFKYHLLFGLQLLKRSQSQINQDVFVASTLKLWKKKKYKGFFVEFGATNGVELSNTLLFEKYFNWNGILVEPGRSWHEDLLKNRKCSIDRRCVYSESGKELTFNDTSDSVYSTLEEFTTTDMHAAKRLDGNRYLVESITLLDLLNEYNAPKIIDYISIDTEGSEYLILENFDFEKYKLHLQERFSKLKRTPA